MVDWNDDGRLFRIGVGLRILDPRDVAPWQGQDFRGLSTNVSQTLAVKGATLQVETIKLDACTLLKLAFLERGNEFQLIDSDLELTSRPLSESVQESLWVQQVTHGYGSLK